MTHKKNLSDFVKQLENHSELTLVGPFAAARPKWPEPAIFVDAGSRHKGPGDLYISVGDGDSSDEELDHVLPIEKDYSDLAFVLRHVPAHIRRLSMVGFLGGRRDHEFINLGELHRFLTLRTQPTECDLDFSVCGFSAAKWPLHLNGIFSLVAFESTRITLTGDCRYQLHQPTDLVALSSFGLSNEASGIVELRCDGPVFIFKNPFS